MLFCVCRNGFWFWDNVVLLTIFALAVTLVFASTLNTYFQLSIMLMIMVVDLTVLAHASPHREALSQFVQVRLLPNSVLSSYYSPQGHGFCKPFAVGKPCGAPLGHSLVGTTCWHPLGPSSHGHPLCAPLGAPLSGTPGWPWLPWLSFVPVTLLFWFIST